MAILKRNSTDSDSWRNQLRRDIPPADYDEEITDEQLEALRKAVAQCVESEEWEIVDGPAW